MQDLQAGSIDLPFLWRPDENHLFYRITDDNRQDHSSPRPNLTLLTFEAELPPPSPVILQEFLTAAEEREESLSLSY